MNEASLGWNDPDLAAYDAMMARYSPGRDERFDLIVDLVAAVAGEAAAVLDAASGPGSLAVRLLDRLPRASVVATDVDPTMLGVARRVASSWDGRMTVDALDLAHDTWHERLGQSRFDAVVLTSATHYFDDAALVGVYERAAAVLRPGGLVLNGDELAVSPWCSELAAAVAERVPPDRAGDWGGWWSTLGATPARAGHHERSAADHLDALRAAGFEQCAVVWQRFDGHLLAARR